MREKQGNDSIELKKIMRATLEREEYQHKDMMQNIYLVLQEQAEIVDRLDEKDEQEKQLAALEGKCSVLTKRLENYTSGIDDELEVVRDRYRKHISKLEDDCIKFIDERNEYKNKLNKTNEVLKQTEKEKEIYISYLKATERKKVYIRKQRNEYKNLLEQKQQEMRKDKKKLEELEKLKSKKADPSDYLTELSRVTGSLEIIVEKIFFESPYLTEKQAIILLRKVKNPIGKRRWRAATIRNRVDTYLKKHDKIERRIIKPPYNINHETNKWGESILHDQHTQNIYNSFRVYLTKIGLKGLTNVLNKRSFDVLTAEEMHNLILSTLHKLGIKIGKHTYRGYLLYFILNNKVIRSGKNNTFRYTIT